MPEPGDPFNRDPADEVNINTPNQQEPVDSSISSPIQDKTSAGDVEADKKKEKSKEEIEIEKAAGLIFSFHGSGEKSADEMLRQVTKRIGPVLDSGIFDKESIIDGLKGCASCRTKEEFSEHVVSALSPIIKQYQENPRVFDILKEKAEAEAEEAPFERINDVFTYGIDKNLAHIHFQPTHEMGEIKRAKLFIAGLDELVEIIKKKPEIDEITATSWLVAKYPEKMEKLGFTLTGPISDEMRQKHFKGDDRPIDGAIMVREEFLKRPWKPSRTKKK